MNFVLRSPSPEEENLLELLVNKASLSISSDWKKKLLVSPMNDGDMGSLLLFPNGELKENRRLGDEVSELQFTDQDDVVVLVSLNTDTEGNLFELDVWKTDFNKLISFPKIPGESSRI